MSHAASSVVRVFSDVVSGVGDVVSGAVNTVSGAIFGKKPDAPAAETPAAPAASATAAKEGTLGSTTPKPESDKGPADAAVESRTKDFETRSQQLGQRAAAAGVTRSDNDADLLGYTAPKRKSASRSILG